MSSEETGLELRSLVTADGMLELSLARVPRPVPAADEVVVRIEASPINPSDLGLLLAGADVSAAEAKGSGAEAKVTAPIAAAVLRGMAGRIGRSMPVGNEGAGVVVAAGASAAAQALLGRTVAMLGGAMYAQFRKVKAADCLALPEGVAPEAGASAFVNPLTALGMVETMRREGHKALVHTAAASNLGQMLNRLCQAEGVQLVNIVRSPAQAEILAGLGAEHIVDTSQPSFRDDLLAALTATGATLAFDAIGGGKLVSQILNGMEAVASSAAQNYSRYGSAVHKQVYIYGGLDTGPTELTRGFGMSWGIGGWLVTDFLGKVGPETVARLRARVASEITTTFASQYTSTLSLADLLKPEIMAAYNRKATGEKYLLNPSLPIG
jgi:NADPH:quinone reductase-like Zn-dependent oxidoreductase